MDATARFWAKVQKSDGCWEWRGARFQRGAGAARVLTYGMFTVGPRDIPAHRYSWEMHSGPIPAGLFVLHHCDNPPCVNPEHLFIGTAADNSRDMVAKGRQSRANAHPARGDANGARRHPDRLHRGEANGVAILTAAKVRDIRARLAAGSSHASVARDFGASKATIGKIARRETWQHVT